MKRFLRSTLLAVGLCAVTLTGPSLAEEPIKVPDKTEAEILLVLRLSYWEVSDKTLAALTAKTRITAKDIEGRRLQTAEVLGVSGQDTFVALVRKSPIVYYDPRASQFQIQYVDSGVKLDAKCRSTDAKTFDVEIRPELGYSTRQRLAGTSPDQAAYPETDVLVVESTLSDVKLGDLILVGSASGASGAAHIHVLDANPKAGNLVVTFELEAP